MPPQKTTSSGSSKRRRADEKESHVSASDSSSSSDSSSEGSSSESGDDTSDDETENALFRPVQANQNGESSEDENESSADNSVDDGDAKESVVVPSATETETKKAKSKSKESPDTTEAPTTVDNTELEDEMTRKTTATVYVEGIPYKADESDVVTHFASCGSVKEVRMPRYQDSGKPRGYAHVVFDSVKSVSKALKLDGQYMLGRYLTVKTAERPRTLDAAIQAQKSVGKVVKGCKTVFVKHLPYDVEEATVKEALSSCGTIVSVRLPLWNHTKKLKGFGYVEFATEEEAAAAAKRSGMKIGDRMVIINLETVGSAPKASFRLSDGRFWKKGEDAKQSLATKLKEKSKSAQPGNHQKKSKRQKTA